MLTYIANNDGFVVGQFVQHFNYFAHRHNLGSRIQLFVNNLLYFFALIFSEFF